MNSIYFDRSLNSDVNIYRNMDIAVNILFLRCLQLAIFSQIAFILYNAMKAA